MSNDEKKLNQYKKLKKESLSQIYNGDEIEVTFYNLDCQISNGPI